MEDNGTQNSNIIMQTLLSIQNSIYKLNDELLNIKNETNKNKENINKLISKIDKNEMNLDNNRDIIGTNHNSNKKGENNMLAKTQIIDRKLEKSGLNKTQIINQNNANELIMNNPEEDKKMKYN